MSPDQSVPNDYRIPIPKVQEGIDLIAGRKFPIIVCQCGNYDQRMFMRLIRSELVPKENKTWQTKRIGVNHVQCGVCGTSIPRVEFEMKAAKLVEESKKKYGSSHNL